MPKNVYKGSLPSLQLPGQASRVDQTLPGTQDRPLALGALLTFYRLLRRIGRQELATRAGISLSLLGMIENGTRLPTLDTLRRISVNLQLSDEQRLQLDALAGYSLPDVPEAPGWELLPDDVLYAKPIFVRDMHLESAIQDRLDLDEVWMVTRRPMALEEPVLGWLRKKLLHTNTRYIYFVDQSMGEEDFDTLWFRLNLQADATWVAKDQARRTAGGAPQLAFVLSPPTLCAPTHTLAIFNPLSQSKRRFGRTAIYQGGKAIGVYAIDDSLLNSVIDLLNRIYPDVMSNPGLPFPRDLKTYGAFCLISAEVPRRRDGPAGYQDRRFI